MFFKIRSVNEQVSISLSKSSFRRMQADPVMKKRNGGLNKNEEYND